MNPKAHPVIVTEEMAGQRIDNFLITYFKGVPKTRVYKSIRKGEVRVNKGRIKPEYKIEMGDTIRIPPLRQSEIQPEIPFIPARVEKSILQHIVYEDSDLIALNKPAGLAVHGGSGLSFGVIEAIRLMKPELKHLELVHRLDRDTSGCLLIAKRRSALRSIHEQLQSNTIEKHYIALVKGDWQAGTLVEAPLLKNQLSSGERIVRVDSRGKPSRTEFKVMQRFTEGATLMEIHLLTGRTHQIRVHSLFVGHPVAGDPKYGDETFNRWMKEKGLNRLFLHASSIEFRLPRTGEKLTIQAPIDEDLKRVLSNIH